MFIKFPQLNPKIAQLFKVYIVKIYLFKNLFLMDRKEFFNKVLFGGSVLLVAPAVFSACSKTTTPGTVGNTVVDLNSSQFASLKTVGGFAYNGNVLIIRSSDTQYTAISRICTHMGCTVAYNSSTKQLVCPCHGARFSSTGAVINGPATSPLTVYSTTLDGTNLNIN